MNNWIKQMEDLQRMAAEVRNKSYTQGMNSSWSDIESLFQHELWDRLNQWDPPFQPSSGPPGRKVNPISKQTGSSIKKTPLDWPAIDMYVTELELIVSCAMPGILRSSLQISLIDEQKLEIRGTIRSNPFADQIKTISLEEQYHGNFVRVVSLPVPAGKRGAYNRWREGVLDIHLMRKVLSNTKDTIPIK
jgi:HSP20 family protein